MRRASIISILLVLLPLSASFAQEDILKGMDVGKGGERFHELLNLTEEQKEKLGELDREARKDHIRMHAEIEVLQIDLEELIEADSPDMKEIEKVVDKIAAIKGEIMKAGVKSLLEKKKVLTKEQWLKLKKFSRRRGFRAMEGMKGRSERTPLRQQRNK